MEISRIIQNALNARTRFIRTLEKADTAKAKGIIRDIVQSKEETFEWNVKDQKTASKYEKEGFESLRRNYSNLTSYFIGKDCALDLDRSIYLFGDTGCGKTLAFEVFKIFTGEVIRTNSFRKVPMKEIIARVNSEGIDSIEHFIRENGKPISLYIEDLGFGVAEVKNYGTSINVIDELIDRRYRLWKDTGYLTHFCSNISEDEIEEAFSPRVASRLSEMCNFIDFNNIDFRKTK